MNRNKGGDLFRRTFSGLFPLSIRQNLTGENPKLYFFLFPDFSCCPEKVFDFFRTFSMTTAPFSKPSPKSEHEVSCSRPTYMAKTGHFVGASTRYFSNIYRNLACNGKFTIDMYFFKHTY